MTYRLLSLDVEPNNDINDIYPTGVTIDFAETPTIKEFCDALKACDRMAPDWPESKVSIEEDGNNDYLAYDEKGKKVYLLRLIKD